MTKASLTKIAVLVNRQMTEIGLSHGCSGKIHPCHMIRFDRGGLSATVSHSDPHRPDAPKETTTPTRTGERMTVVVQSNRASHKWRSVPKLGPQSL